MEISQVRIENEHFREMRDHTQRNPEIAEYYQHLFLDTGKFSLLNHAKGVKSCVKWWDVNYYRIQQVKDIRRVNLCHDKFCWNCQSLLSSKRQMKYTPVLDGLRSKYQLFHVVFTVKNVPGDELLPAIDKMYNKFRHLIRFLAGDKHVRGVDFEQYGYAGGLRALEVTTKEDEKTFHPHFHVVLLLRKGITFDDRRYINKFSFDHGVLVRKFTSFEILLQKIWYLLMNSIPVTKENIANLKEGYSVIVEQARKGEYHELFKYACKGAFEDGKIPEEDTFQALYYALYKRRMIQGYGVLFNIKDKESLLELEEEVSGLYDQIVARLQTFEDPIFRIESIDEIVAEKNCSYISKSNLKRLLIARRNEEKEEDEREGRRASGRPGPLVPMESADRPQAAV